MNRIVYYIYSLVFTACIFIISLYNNTVDVDASYQSINYSIDMKKSTIKIDDAFGSYQQTVDKNIYNEMNKYVYDILIETYGDLDTPMFNKAKETINPCMAFATTWGEAGQSYGGISYTTVMDFNPKTYIYDIDWISVSTNLEQVDDDWYRVNTMSNYNTNESGNVYHMPVALLQYPRSGSRETSAMTGLGVGPYQITSSDWDTWELENRVSPILGFSDSIKKTGSAWTKADIDPISDLTVYAALSMGHQGGGLIEYQFGKDLMNIMNTPSVQSAFNEVGRELYLDLRDRSYDKQMSLSDVDLKKGLQQIEEMTGVDFSKYTGGPGRTNKGNYLALHCLRYVFYKNYFTSAM